MKKLLSLFNKNPIVAFVSVYLFISFIAKFFFTETRKNFNKLISTFNLDYSKGISKQDAILYAGQLYTFMKDAGTEESPIKSIFLKLKSKDDYKKVYKEFGVKKYDINGKPSLFDWLIDFYTEHDLTGWLFAELDRITDYFTYNTVKKVVERDGFTF